MTLLTGGSFRLIACVFVQHHTVLHLDPVDEFANDCKLKVSGVFRSWCRDIVYVWGSCWSKICYRPALAGAVRPVPCLMLESAAGAVISLIFALLLLCLSSTCQLGATRLGISFYAHSNFVLVLQLVYMQLCTNTVFYPTQRNTYLE